MFLMVRDGLSGGALVGNVAALVSAAGFGAYSVSLRWGRVNDMLPTALLGAALSSVVAALILAATGLTLLVPVRDAGLAALLGAGITALGMVMFTLGSKVVPAAELTLLSLIEVLLAPIWVWLFLGETATANTLLGGGVLLAGVLLNAMSTTRATRSEGVAEMARPVKD
jgi:drug/metabolite transporter (DMT)-like permease